MNPYDEAEKEVEACCKSGDCIHCLRSQLAEAEGVMEEMEACLDSEGHGPDGCDSRMKYQAYKSKHATDRLPIEVCVKCGCGRDNHPDYLCNANYQIRL